MRSRQGQSARVGPGVEAGGRFGELLEHRDHLALRAELVLVQAFQLGQGLVEAAQPGQHTGAQPTVGSLVAFWHLQVAANGEQPLDARQRRRAVATLRKVASLGAQTLRQVAGAHVGHQCLQLAVDALGATELARLQRWQHVLRQQGVAQIRQVMRVGEHLQPSPGLLRCFGLAVKLVVTPDQEPPARLHARAGRLRLQVFLMQCDQAGGSQRVLLLAVVVQQTLGQQEALSRR